MPAKRAELSRLKRALAGSASAGGPAGGCPEPRASAEGERGRAERERAGQPVGVQQLADAISARVRNGRSAPREMNTRTMSGMT